MSIGTEKLKIILYTNLPNQDKIEFKRSLLYHPDLKGSSLQLDEYPYFTDVVEYPMDKLKALSYIELVDFFFNQRQFNRLLKGEKKASKDTMNQNMYANNNIKTMFTLLFPTGFPLDNDYHTSYDLINGVKTTGSLFKNPFSGSRFSYLKVNNNIYTIKSSIWLNDILNHPNYKELIETTNSLFDNIIKKRDGIKAIQDQTIMEISESINGVMEKIYKGVVLSVSKLSMEGTITIGKETLSLYNNLLKLQYTIFLVSGVQKTDIIERQTEILSKNIKTPLHQEEIINLFTNIIKDSESLPSYDSFREQQTSIIRYIKLLTPIKTFIVTGITNQIKGIIDETNQDIEKIITQYPSIQSQVDVYEKMGKILGDEPTAATFDVSTSVKQKYSSFIYNLRNFRYANRESSNIYLQNLINFRNDSMMTKFFHFFRKLYDYFINNMGDKLTDSEIQLLNIGVCSINMDSKDLPRKEICVIIDFIDGEVNSQNKGSIFCPYTGEHLGNQFEKLMDKTEKRNLLWSVDDDERSLFKIQTLSSVNKEKATPEKTLELGSNPVANPSYPGKETVNNSELSSWLTTYIIPVSDKIINGIFGKITTIKNEPFSKEDLLDFLMKYNTELYRFLNEMMAKKEKYSFSTEKRLLELDGKYSTKLKLNETELAIKEARLTEKEKTNLLFDIEQQKLYLVLVKYLAEFEKKKQKSMGGKKNTNRHGNRTSKLSNNYLYGRRSRSRGNS